MRCELSTDETQRQGAAMPGPTIRGRASRVASCRPGTSCTDGNGCSLPQR